MSHSDITRSRHLVVAAIFVSAAKFRQHDGVSRSARARASSSSWRKCDEQFNRGPLIS
jgi:hypothetical protein